MNRILTSIFAITSLIVLCFATSAAAQTVIKPPPITFLINQEVFVPGDILVVYGKGFENDSLVIRLFDPAGKAVRIESIRADNDGVFTEQIFTWSPPSRNLVYGKYTVELASSLAPSYNETRTVTFSDTPSTNPTTSTNPLVVKLDSPTQVSVGQTFRIFVQIT